MTKLYVPALALTLLGGTAFAQSNGGNHGAALKQRSLPQIAQHHPTPAASPERAVIWSNDFSNPSDWTIGNINDPNNDNWVIGTMAPSGAFAIDPIASTTAANGFALFDSDLLCGGSQNAWIAMANPVDLSTYSGVVLIFQQNYRKFEDSCFVETSTDGVNWSSITVNDIDVNASTANPDTRTINVSSQIGGAAQAWVRFRFKGGCDYAWMIDDVSLNTLPDNELVMDYGYTSQFGGGYEYGRVPQNQMTSTLNVGAGIINFGSNTQNGVSVHVSLMDASSAEIASTDIPLGTINNSDTMIADANLTLPSPMPVGVYTALFTVTSDSIGVDFDTANNHKYRYFEVTNDLYSVDGLGVNPDSVEQLTQIGTASFTDNTQDVRLLNYFEVHAQQTFTGVEIRLGSAAQAGSYFTVSVYDTVDVLATPADLTAPLMESDIHVITAQDITNKTASVAFLDPLPLGVGAYFVSANMFQEAGNDLYIIDDTTVPQPNIASMLWIPVDEPNEQYLYGGNGTAWAVRLSSATDVSVQEVAELDGVSVYPNPTAGLLHVNSSKTEPLKVEVRNVLGQIVKTAIFNGTLNTVDLSGSTAGIYTVRVSNGINFTVKRIALN